MNTKLEFPDIGSRQRDPKNRLLVVVAMVGAAVLAVVVTFVLAQAVGAKLLVTPEFSSTPPEELALESVVVATVALSLLGVGLAWLIGRFLPQPRTVFTVGVVIGLVGYGVLAFVKTEAVSDGLWLNAMHLAAAVPVVGGLLSGAAGYLD